MKQQIYIDTVLIQCYKYFEWIEFSNLIHPNWFWQTQIYIFIKWNWTRLIEIWLRFIWIGWDMTEIYMRKGIIHLSSSWWSTLRIILEDNYCKLWKTMVCEFALILIRYVWVRQAIPLFKRGLQYVWVGVYIYL